MAMRPFKSIRPANPGRSSFDLSYSKLMTCDMGKLYPVMCDEVIPGDKFKIGNEIVIRFQPLVAPVLHEVKVTCHYFFVPYRLLWPQDANDEGWQSFITGGKNGTDDSVLPRWSTIVHNGIGSLWDYLGFPPNVTPIGRYPLDFPRRAYNLIWNEYYMDETLQTKRDITDFQNDVLLHRAWTKDYFTSCLPWQQRGDAPALPLTGFGSATWDDDIVMEGGLFFGDDTNGDAQQKIYSPRILDGVLAPIATPDTTVDTTHPLVPRVRLTESELNNNIVDFSSALTFNVSDLRLAFQVQKWLERNARGGFRYTEFLRAHWGVSPNDDRLQRPEYIGGSMAPVIFSEVLQTSNNATDNGPQGSLAGHGISVSQEFCADYFVKEYGLIMGLMSITPVPMYSQGINRQWLRMSKFDFPMPEFVNLSEQAVEMVEIFASGIEEDNTTPFGFQGRMDELRVKQNMVCGLMRTDFNYWHLAREFETAPELNNDFVRCEPDTRIFAVENEPGMIVHFGNKIHAIRPIPIIAEPGLIDHN